MGTKQKTQQQGQLIPLMLNDEYFFNRGLKAHRNRELEKAVKYLERAVSLNPSEPVFSCQLAIVLTEMGHYKQSNELLLKIIKSNDESMIDCYYFLANNYAHLGLFQEAHKYVTMYLDEAPDGEFVGEADDLLELLSIDSDEEEDLPINTSEDTLIIKKEQACELLDNGELHEAKELLEALVKDYPKFWPAYNNLALAHFYLGEVFKGISLTEKVLENSNGNLHALCNLAVFKHYIGQENEVNQMIEQLKKVYPFDVDHRYKLGITFALLGEYEPAYTWLRWLQKYKYAGGYAYYYWLSISAYHSGHENFAREIWKKVLELNPDKEGSEPWNSIENMELAKINPVQAQENQTEAKMYTFETVNKNESYLDKFLRLASNDNKKNDTVLYGYQITKLLDEKCMSHKEEILTFWLKQYYILDQKNMKLNNVNAWSAATEYVWKKNHNIRVTQKDLAQNYNVSPSTIQKYVKSIISQND